MYIIVFYNKNKHISGYATQPRASFTSMQPEQAPLHPPQKGLRLVLMFCCFCLKILNVAPILSLTTGVYLLFPLVLSPEALNWSWRPLSAHSPGSIALETGNELRPLGTLRCLSP